MDKEHDIKPSEITPKELYMNRRQFIAVATAVLTGLSSLELLVPSVADAGQKLKVERRGQYTLQEEQTSYKDAANYNNFYEFSTNKEDVAELSRNFRTRPWTLAVEGLVKKLKVYDIDTLLKLFPLEERVIFPRYCGHTKGLGRINNLGGVKWKNVRVIGSTVRSSRKRRYD